MEKIVVELPPSEEISDPSLQTLPKVAVIGKPNVGKSTLINAFLGKKRLIVSTVPGTTRDSIDSVCTYYGEKFLFIDTAGIRKKQREYSVEGLFGHADNEEHRAGRRGCGRSRRLSGHR